MLLVLAFYAVFTPVSTTYLGHLATENGAEGFLVEILTMLSNFILEFLYTRFVVYRNSCDTAKNGGKRKKTPLKNNKSDLYAFLFLNNIK